MSGFAQARPPLTWLMLGRKVGDNGQIKALAEALGWPYVVKNMAYRRTELLTNLFAGPTLAGLDSANSDPLEPPWPELVISAGRRNEPLVRWIAEQAGRENVRLVHVGRPWALHECFDLIVTTPQYRLPDKPNILHNEAPMHALTPALLAAEARAWANEFEPLPRPRTAVLLGGNAGPYNFDRENGALLGAVAAERAKARGGSLLITSSARTPLSALKGLEASLDLAGVPRYLHRWSAGATRNPYLAMLGWADEVVVTSDSMSMLAEAAATGKPVLVYDLDRRPGSFRPDPPEGSAVPPRGIKERLADFRLNPWIYRAGMKLGPSRLTRDVSVIHRRQVAAGRAAWLGRESEGNGVEQNEAGAGNKAGPSGLDDTERAAGRVRALFAPGAPPTPVVPPSPLPEWLRRFTQG